MMKWKAPKYVHMYRDRHGVFRAYFRRSGQKSIPLPGKLGGRVFMAAYRKALNGEASPPKNSTRSKFAHLEGGPHVYFIRTGDHIKIGYSRDASSRLADLQIACPTSLECLHVVEGTKKTEKRFHLRFRKERVRGEWFKVSPRILTFIEQDRNRTGSG